MLIHSVNKDTEQQIRAENRVYKILSNTYHSFNNSYCMPPLSQGLGVNSEQNSLWFSRSLHSREEGQSSKETNCKFQMVIGAIKKNQWGFPGGTVVQNLPAIYPEKTIIQKESCTTMFIAALFTIARTWKQPKCPSTDEWLKKMWHIYTMEYSSVIKKERNNAICSNMDGTRDYHTE